eukprot:GHVL01008643.1.p1 GENE.GHVL01008643.1~~GHVL01008643.1.p1  ORF type:complete len:319 (+),score=21.83 GHVL01008643.1:133-1089(+)
MKGYYAKFAVVLAVQIICTLFIWVSVACVDGMWWQSRDYNEDRNLRKMAVIQVNFHILNFDAPTCQEPLSLDYGVPGPARLLVLAFCSHFHDLFAPSSPFGRFRISLKEMYSLPEGCNNSPGDNDADWLVCDALIALIKASRRAEIIGWTSLGLLCFVIIIFVVSALFKKIIFLQISCYAGMIAAALGVTCPYTYWGTGKDLTSVINLRRFFLASSSLVDFSSSVNSMGNAWYHLLCAAFISLATWFIAGSSLGVIGSLMYPSSDELQDSSNARQKEQSKILKDVPFMDTYGHDVNFPLNAVAPPYEYSTSWQQSPHR